jgi:hypothetical protein
LLIGKFRKEITINPYDGYDQAKEKDKYEQARIERIKKLIGAVGSFMSKSSTECSKADTYSYISPTVERNRKVFHIFERIMATPIYYVHAILQCT